MLPRPIAHPLRVVFIPQPDYSDEKLLDWALRDKQSAATQTLVPETARVAVLYGKGRLAGSVLSGDAISAREILGQLALVGESCECETSREWMKEGSIPFLWNAKQAQAAPNELGFDPHSPLVRAEMIRIVSQGPKAKSDSTDATSAGPSDAIERLLIGYSEAALGTKRSSENAAAVDATPNLASLPENAASSLEISTIPSQVVANVQLGNSWDLDEPTTTFPSSSSVVSPPNNPIDNSTSTIASEKPICEECLEGELPNDFSASQSLTLASAQSESPDPGSAFPNWAVIATTLAFLTFASIAIASWILFLK